MRHSATLLLCASLLLAACGARQPAAPSGAAAPGSAAAPAHHADAPGIDWFNGSVDAAFAAALAFIERKGFRSSGP